MPLDKETIAIIFISTMLAVISTHLLDEFSKVLPESYTFHFLCTIVPNHCDILGILLKWVVFTFYLLVLTVLFVKGSKYILEKMDLISE